jgi:hypothetical protein
VLAIALQVICSRKYLGYAVLVAEPVASLTLQGRGSTILLLYGAFPQLDLFGHERLRPLPAARSASCSCTGPARR